MCFADSLHWTVTILLGLTKVSKQLQLDRMAWRLLATDYLLTRKKNSWKNTTNKNNLYFNLFLLWYSFIPFRVICNVIRDTVLNGIQWIIKTQQPHWSQWLSNCTLNSHTESEFRMRWNRMRKSNIMWDEARARAEWLTWVKCANIISLFLITEWTSSWSWSAIAANHLQLLLACAIIFPSLYFTPFHSAHSTHIIECRLNKTLLKT